jgi:hypothetical protein
MSVWMYVCLNLSECLSVWMYVCLSVCLNVCLSEFVWMSVCLSECVSVWMSVCQSECMSVCLNVCMSVCMSVCLSFCSHGTTRLPLDSFMNLSDWTKHFGVYFHRKPINASKWSIFLRCAVNRSSQHFALFELDHVSFAELNYKCWHGNKYIWLKINYYFWG